MQKSKKHKSQKIFTFDVRSLVYFVELKMIEGFVNNLSRSMGVKCQLLSCLSRQPIRAQQLLRKIAETQLTPASANQKIRSESSERSTDRDESQNRND